MSDPILIFVSGPYSRGNMVQNIRAAILAADELCHRGFVPYIPHLTGFVDLVCPHPYEFWLTLDLHWLRQCHGVLRLPGESPGADRECAEAKRCGIPVFQTWREIEAWQTEVSRG